MKQLFLIGFVFILLSNTAAGQADTISTPRNIIKVDLFSPVYRAFIGYYERVLSDNTSIQFGIIAGGDFFMGRVAYRFYLSEEPAPSGIYVSPTIGLGAEMGDPAFALALVVGAQKLFKQKITLEANLGPGYMHSGGDGQFTLFGGIVIGIAF
jgi:hypothetical protein